MSRLTATFDRVITFLLAAVLLCLGVVLIGRHFGERHADAVVDYLNLPRWVEAYDWDRLPWVLLGGGIVAILLGLWLVAVNVRRRRVGRVHSTATSGLGAINVNVAHIADAMAESLNALPKVTRAQAKVVTDRGTKTLELTVTAQPTIDVLSLKRAITAQEAAFRSAVRDMPIASSYRIHLGPVERATD